MRQLFIILGLLVPVVCFAAELPVTDPAAHDPSAKIGDAAMTQFRKNPDAMAKLSPEEYAITQEGATERPFHNRYWNNKEEGLYVDVVSGEPLFSSRQKFDSGSGWPSFTKPLSPTAITEHKDASHGMIRVEVRSKNADSHLGHVFNDGPREEGGARYCINSGALRFIPKDKLAEEGYGAFLPLFDGPVKK